MERSEERASLPSMSIGPARIRQTGAVTEELLAAFAKEAAEVHRARCDGIKEYLTLAPFFTQPEPRYHRTKQVALVLLSVVALVAAYWWWKNVNGTEPVQPDRQVISPRLQWQPLQVSHHYRAGESFEFSLPRLERLPEDVPVEVTLETSGDQPGWLQLDRERLHIRWNSAACGRKSNLSAQRSRAHGAGKRQSIIDLTDDCRLIGSESSCPATPGTLGVVRPHRLSMSRGALDRRGFERA